MEIESRIKIDPNDHSVLANLVKSISGVSAEDLNQVLGVVETAGLANATTASVPQVVFVKDAGQASVTAGICRTVTLKEQVLEPQTLVAVQVTRFAPKGNTLPLAGTQPTSVPPLTAGLA